MIDFLIIGGGIAGISAAASLAPLGRTVLLERETSLGYHASGRSAAMYFENYGNDTVCALNRASFDYLRTCAGGRVLKPRGLLMLAREGQQAALTAAAKTSGARLISPSEAQAMVPIVKSESLAGAAHTDDGQDLDTDLLIQDFLTAARGAGTQISTGAEVTGITREGSGWRVDLGDDQLQAGHLVNAAGAWGDHIAVLAGVAPIGLTPYRRSIARMPAPGGYDLGSWPMMMGAEEDWFAKPDAGKWLVSPAEEHAAEPHDAYADDMVLAEGIARYQDCVTPEVTRVETTWAGLRTFAPDRTLVLGRDPGDESFIWCVGQGGYGFQTAPAACAVLAASVTGSVPEVGSDIAVATSPARFKRG